MYRYVYVFSNRNPFKEIQNWVLFVIIVIFMLSLVYNRWYINIIILEVSEIYNVVDNFLEW